MNDKIEYECPRCKDKVFIDVLTPRPPDCEKCAHDFELVYLKKIDNNPKQKEHTMAFIIKYEEADKIIGNIQLYTRALKTIIDKNNNPIDENLLQVIEILIEERDNIAKLRYFVTNSANKLNDIRKVVHV